MLPNNKNTFQVLLRGLKGLVMASHLPSDVVTAVLASWMAKVTPRIACPSPKHELIEQPAIASFAEWLADTDILTGAFWLSSAYAALVGNDVRKASAMYFTPPYLANRIIENAGASLFSGKIIDPACGGAAFLAPAAARIAAELADQGKSSKAILSYIQENLIGVDADPFLCQLSVTFLRMVLAPYIQASRVEPQLRVACGDGLLALEESAGSFALVLCNPPYRKLPAEDVQSYSAFFSDVLRGQPNLYALFIRHAMRLAQPGGKVVLLTPMSYLSGQSFSRLRKRMSDEGHVQQLDLIHDKNGIFFGAEQDSVVTVWAKADVAGAATRIYLLSADHAPAFVGGPTLPKGDRSWPIPRTPSDVELMPLFYQWPYSLKSYGYQPRTGPIVVHRDSRRRYKRIHSRATPKLPVPLIWASDIGTDGVLKLNVRGKNEARFVDLESTSSRAIVRKPAVVVQRVTSSDQKRRLVCAAIPSDLYAKYGGVTGENHVCFIEQTSSMPIVSPELLAVILMSKTVDRLFRCISGATNVSAYELMQLPLPDPRIVQASLQNGNGLELAIRMGFGLPTPTGETNTINDMETDTDVEDRCA